MITCPICRLENIPSSKEQCPQCDADLTCFKVLDSLPDELPGEPKPAASGFPAMVAAGVLLLALCVLGAFLFFRLQQLDAGLRDRELMLTESLKGLDTKLDLLARETAPGHGELISGSDGAGHPRAAGTGPTTAKVIEEAPEAPGSASPETAHAVPEGGLDSAREAGVAQGPSPPEFWTYYSNGRDTLWFVSEKYYGSGRYYPVLLEHNPGLGIFGIQKGTPIKVLRDIHLVEEIYERIVVREGNKLYWSYKVVEGDTIESIVARFHGKAQRSRATGLYSGLRPGHEIKIYLN